MKFLLCLVCGLLSLGTYAQPLVEVDQDFAAAKRLAAASDKLIFVDFYTTWCRPCKVLEKLVFENDSIRTLLGEGFVMLKYDAERDSVFHLSKKYHVISYPTGLILTAEGAAVNRRYSFDGDGLPELSASVMSFAGEGVALAEEGKFHTGYANTVDADAYPDFYREYVERTNTKVTPETIAAYLDADADRMGEVFFAVALYMGGDASEEVTDFFLANKDEYASRFGERNTNTALYMLANGKFARAITDLDSVAYATAVTYATTGLDELWTSTMLPRNERDFKRARQLDAGARVLRREARRRRDGPWVR